MEIKQITLTNFRNFEKLVLTLDHQTSIVRDNAYGKSNIADAIIWVFTGKLRDGSSDIESIKPKHNPKATVEVEVVLDNGNTLRKAYKENWTKVRGTNELELKGHLTSCFLNGLEMSVTNFDTELERILQTPKEHFHLLMDPTYFGTKLEWKKRREIVNKVVGEITFDEIVKSDETFAKNPELTKGLQETLQLFSGKIDMAKKSLNQDLTKYRKEAQDIEGQISGLSKLVQTINPTELAALRLENKEAREKLAQLAAGTNPYSSQKRIEEIETELEHLRARYKSTQATTFPQEMPKAQLCPNCGHNLGGSTFDKRLEQYHQDLKDYEKLKKERLASINLQGNHIKQELEKLKAQTGGTIESYIEQESKLQETIKTTQSRIDEYNAAQLAQREIDKAQENLVIVRNAIATTEGKVDLLSLYVSGLLKHLNARIEIEFGDIKFRLIEDNIKEGSWNEVCDVLDGLVPYDRTNHAQQIKLGVQVVEAIRNKLGYASLPIIIDNAEAIVDRTFKTTAQVICLAAGKENE